MTFSECIEATLNVSAISESEQARFRSNRSPLSDWCLFTAAEYTRQLGKSLGVDGGGNEALAR